MTLKASELKEGQTFEAVVAENLSRTQIVQYAGASGDYNPLHTDEVFATQVAGYPSVFAHGMLTMGMTGRMLTDLPVYDLNVRPAVPPLSGARSVCSRSRRAGRRRRGGSRTGGRARG